MDEQQQATPRAGIIITFGAAVKALGGGRVSGYLVQWGSAATKDGEGEWFTPDTDFDTDFPARASVYYHHGQHPAIGRQRLTHGKMERDEFGIRIDATLDLSNPQQAKIYRQVEGEELGWSSGSLPHVTIPPRENPGGPIEQWPLGHDASLTPIPSDRRNVAIAVKAAPLPELETPADGLSVGPGEKRSLAEATERITEGLEILIGDYRTHAMKAGRKLSAARRERLARVRQLIDEMLSETEPHEAEPDPEPAPAPVMGSRATEETPRPKPSSLPDVNDLYTQACRQLDGCLLTLPSGSPS